jgi:hypothetical protein
VCGARDSVQFRYISGTEPTTQRRKDIIAVSRELRYTICAFVELSLINQVTL